MQPEPTFGGRQIAIKALVGSHNYNMDNERSDKDYKFFVYPTFDDLYTGKRFSNAKQGDEFDYSVHDVRSLTDLIWSANINFIEVLYSKEKYWTPGLTWLFYNADRYATANLPRFYNATFGMAHQKLKELHKGTAKTDILIEQFGYDTKQACHALRCLYTLSRFMVGGSMRGSLSYDYTDPQRTILMCVKNGVYNESYFLKLVDDWKEEYDASTKSFYNSFSVDEQALFDMNDHLKEAIRARFKS